MECINHREELLHEIMRNFRLFFCVARWDNITQIVTYLCVIVTEDEIYICQNIMMMICEGFLGDFSLVILKGSFFYIKKSSKSRCVIAKSLICHRTSSQSHSMCIIWMNYSVLSSMSACSLLSCFFFKKQSTWNGKIKIKSTHKYEEGIHPCCLAFNKIIMRKISYSRFHRHHYNPHVALNKYDQTM